MEKFKSFIVLRKAVTNMLTVARQVGYMPGGATPGAVTGMITLRRVSVVKGAVLLLTVHQQNWCLDGIECLCVGAA
jgi:hypothetical protein